MPDNEKLGLTQQERADAIQEIARLRSQTEFLSELIRTGNCNADEAKCHMTLIRQVHDSLAGLLHTDALSKDLDDAYASCRAANARVRELEKQLGEDVTAQAAVSRLQACESWFQAWYKLCGFDYMSLEWGPYGLSFKSSSEIDHRGDDPENITFGNRELAVMIAPLVPYEFLNYDLKRDTFHDSLKDTQANHDKLDGLFIRTFTGARIFSFTSHLDGNDRLLRIEGHVPWESIEKWHGTMLEKAAKLPRPTGRLYVEKAELASRLASRAYTSHIDKKQLAEDRTRIAWLRLVTGLWDQAMERLGECGKTASQVKISWTLPGQDTPMEHTFSKGATKARIGRWFAESFKLDWKADLDEGNLPKNNKDEEACDAD